MALWHEIYIYQRRLLAFNIILFCFSADASSTVTSINSNVNTHYSGNVTWLSMAIFRSSCFIAVKYFPYDVQNCTMAFDLWSHGIDQLNLLSHSNEGNVTMFRTPNGSFYNINLDDLFVIFSCCLDNVPFMKNDIVIKRI